MAGKQARLVQSRRPENAIARSAIQIKGAFIITRSVILIIFNGRGTISKVGDKYCNTLRVLQLWGSACWVSIENYQCRIPIHREPVR